MSLRNKSIFGLVMVLVTLYSCKKIKEVRTLDDPKGGLDITNVINFSYENEDSEILADESDRIYIYADLDSINVSPNYDVVFTTEKGSFIGGDESKDFKEITVRADAYKAKVILKGDDVVNEKVGITAKVGEYIVYDVVKFTRSYPDEVLNSVQKLTLLPNLSDKIFIDIDLRKVTGKVSSETRVDFEIITLEGTPSVSLPVLYWSESNAQTEMISTALDTGSVAIIPYVFNGQNKIKSIDTLFITIDN